MIKNRMLLRNTEEIKNVIRSVYFSTNYGRDGGYEVLSRRPIAMSVLESGWDRDIYEAAYIVCGSGNKAKGFVRYDVLLELYCINIDTCDKQSLYATVDKDGRIVYLADTTDVNNTVFLINS